MLHSKERFAKFRMLFRSRKFWALMIAMTAVAGGYFSDELTMWQAVQATVAAVGAYSIATGIEDGGQTVPPDIDRG